MLLVYAGTVISYCWQIAFSTIAWTQHDVSSLHRRDIPTLYFAREWHEHIDFAAHRVEVVGVNRKYCSRYEEIRTYYLRRPDPDAVTRGRENFVVYLLALRWFPFGVLRVRFRVSGEYMRLRKISPGSNMSLYCFQELCTERNDFVKQQIKGKQMRYLLKKDVFVMITN